MARSMVSGRVVRTRGKQATEGACLALSGKGLPGGAALEEAIEAVAAAAAELRAIGRTRRHEFRPKDPEVRVRTPRAGGRGGASWTVLVRVPGWVTAAEVKAAAAAAAVHRGVAKSIRLSPVDPLAAPPEEAPGRDRLPGQLRRTRVGAPQHRARERRT